MKQHAHKPAHAHPADPYAFSRRDYLKAAIAAVMGAPVLWLATVVFLSALGSPS